MEYLSEMGRIAGGGLQHLLQCRKYLAKNCAKSPQPAKPGPGLAPQLLLQAARPKPRLQAARSPGYRCGGAKKLGG